jgi:hypothetical protein
MDDIDGSPERWRESLYGPSLWKRSRRWEHLAPGYLKGSTVEPLGVFRDYCFYRVRDKTVALRWDDHTPDAIRELFAACPDELMKFWAGEYAVASTGKTIMRGWLAAAAADSLRMACCHEGVVYPPEIGLRLTAKGMIEGPVIPAPWGRPLNGS